MDLARDAGPLLGDRAAELGEADRAPDADEQDGVREQPQEVALRDVVAARAGREDVVQLREERERGAEASQRSRSLPVRAEAQAEADHRDERKERVRGERRRELERLVGIDCPGGRRQRGGARLLRDDPDQPEQDRDRDERSRRERRPRAFTRRRDERRQRDQRRGEQAAADAGPGLGPVRASRRRARARSRTRGSPSAADENPPQRSRSSAPALDGEAHACEDGHDRSGERDRGVEHEPQPGQLVRVAQARVGRGTAPGAAPSSPIRSSSLASQAW